MGAYYICVINFSKNYRDVIIGLCKMPNYGLRPLSIHQYVLLEHTSHAAYRPLLLRHPNLFFFTLHTVH